MFLISSSCYVVDYHEEKKNTDRFLQGTFRLFGSDMEVSDLLTISNDAQQNNQIHRNFIEQKTVETEEVLNANEHELIPLWGKTSW